MAPLMDLRAKRENFADRWSHHHQGPAVLVHAGLIFGSFRAGCSSVAATKSRR